MWHERAALLILTAALVTAIEPRPNFERTLERIYERLYRTGTHTRTTSDVGEPLLLTPYIEKGMLDEARNAAYVDPSALLPGLDSYAGYLTVNKEYNSNLWFWYFPVVDRPIERTPWIIWLQGGPGASSLYGLFTEIGPLSVTKDITLEEIEYSWGKNHSLLFIDNPVGTGFSFTDSERGYATNQTTIGEHLHHALQQFLTIFPELRDAPLIVAGESYAGKHIPSLAIQIHWHKNSSEPPINLSGLAIGNGFIDPITMQYSSFVKEVGLVDDNVAEALIPIENKIISALKKGDNVEAFGLYNVLLGTIMYYSHLDNIYNYEKESEDLDGLYTNFLSNDEVRSALHVGNTNFTNIGKVYNKLIPDFMNSSKPWLEELLGNYRVMCYSGHLDVIVAYRTSVNTHKSLKAATNYFKANRRPWFHNEKLAGYYKVAGNLTEVMVRLAGHMVPADVPAQALGLISAFARGITLEQDTGPLVQPYKPIRSRKLTPKNKTS